MSFPRSKYQRKAIRPFTQEELRDIGGEPHSYSLMWNVYNKLFAILTTISKNLNLYLSSFHFKHREEVSPASKLICG